MGRRNEILKRATEVFERQGVNRTSIEDIAKAVGVKREAIYYYFRSRGEILLKIILPQSTAMTAALQEIFDSDLSDAEKLRAAIRNHLDGFNPNYLEMTVALREEHFMDDDPKLKELRRSWSDYSQLWTRLIAEGQGRGAFKGALDPKMVAFGILGMCNWLSRWYDPSKDVTVEQIIETFFTMTAHGILASPDEAPAPL
jgi:TetR/AcrR family transcriptional regulator, cholesterol catabolism regulator